MDTAAVLPEMPEGPREYQSMERRAGHDRRQSNWTHALDLQYRNQLCGLLNELEALLVAMNNDAEAAMSEGFASMASAMEDWADRLEHVTNAHRALVT
jgi:hypothetical protein